MSERKTVYFLRDSFCMGDDVTAPNLRRYMWNDTDWVPECKIFGMVDDYIGTNLPGYYWRGYAGCERIVDINLHREDLAYSKECTLAENWKELLREHRCVYFMHKKYEDRDKLPETLDEEEYSFEDAEEIYKEYGSDDEFEDEE